MRPTTPPDSATTKPNPSLAATDSTNPESALQNTRIAIARWTNGIHSPQMLVPGMVRISPQARWYAQANNGFQEWVNHGGFAQAFEEPLDAAPSRSAPTLDPGAAAMLQRILGMIGTENADTCLD